MTTSFASTPGDFAPGWYAVLRAAEAVPRHVAFVRLCDEEIALWRDDDGRINAWENRCPHRGMRLTLGTNTGTELKCRYHGWRFATESGACTFIPAHPEQTPPKAAVVRTYRCIERYDLLWIAHGDVAGEPAALALHDTPVTTLRSVTIHAPQADVAAALAREPHAATTAFFLQPESARVTTVHGADGRPRSGAEALAFVRAENERLTVLRRTLEAVSA
jgi:phenylpropionate dioxygenase-like ring-hydroxylating dioxygenase large terminal subunit